MSEFVAPVKPPKKPAKTNSFYISPTSSTWASVPSPSQSTKKRSTRKRLLKAFSRTVKQSPKLAKLLVKLCSSDSGSCITFGKYVKPFKKLFHDFTFFQYAQPEMRSIGAASANGFVYEIAYEHHGVRAHTILKCSLPDSMTKTVPDSLYYEYLVGHLFVNRANLQFPCFLETYGAYDIPATLVEDMAKVRPKTFPVDKLTAKATAFPPHHTIAEFAEQIHTSCEHQYNIAVLIQHISASYSMKSHFKLRYQDKNYYDLELPQLLYQVYGPLSVLGETFTHYDLHRDNVLLYNLGARAYIQMNYVYKDMTVSFKTHLICKIIDYGRSYFHVDEDINSEAVYHKVCEVCVDPDPDNACGAYKGYGFVDPNVSQSDLVDNHYIQSSRHNISHDLRLMNEFKVDSLFPKKTSSRLMNIFHNVEYETMYGTPARASDPSEEEFVNNVHDVTIQLGSLILEPGYQAANTKFYAHAASVGTLHVYMDGSSTKSMRFDPVNVKTK